MKLRRDKMPPHMRSAVEAALAAQDDRAGLAAALKGTKARDRDAKPENVIAHARGPAPKRSDGYRSKAEANYAAWLVSLTGVVWRYERHAIALPGVRTRYRADFSVRLDIEGIARVSRRNAHEQLLLDGPALVEVKGTKEERPYWRSEAARLRALTGAAEWWESLRVPLYVAWRVDGEWRHELVPVRP